MVLWYTEVSRLLHWTSNRTFGKKKIVIEQKNWISSVRFDFFLYLCSPLLSTLPPDSRFKIQLEPQTWLSTRIPSQDLTPNYNIFSDNRIFGFNAVVSSHIIPDILVTLFFSLLTKHHKISNKTTYFPEKYFPLYQILLNRLKKIPLITEFTDL